MNRILILDLETTGTDPTKDHVIEVGAVEWCLEHRAILSARSCLVHCDEANAAEAVNGIPRAMYALHGVPPAYAWKPVAQTSDKVPIVAHFAEFDRVFCPPEIQARAWIDSADLEWPRKPTSMALTALALAHGVAVTNAHRAIYDCLLLARMFERAAELGADVAAMLERGLRPKAEYVAMVSFDERELAKQAGFRWEPSLKQWRRKLFIEDVDKLAFPVRKVAA